MSIKSKYINVKKNVTKQKNLYIKNFANIKMGISRAKIRRMAYKRSKSKLISRNGILRQSPNKYAEIMI